MTRLFLRFFIGVIAILLAAWLIQGTVLRVGRARQTAEQIERSLGGGARLAGKQLLGDDSMSELTQTQIDRRMAEIQELFVYPVKLIPWWTLNLTNREKARLENGEVVFTETGVLISRVSQDRISRFGATGKLEDSGDTPLQLNDDYVFRFGPLPTFQGPSQRSITLGLGLVMLLAATAIAILLRPVALPLRAVERTATAIADGDLAARIDPRHVPKGLALASAFNTMASKTERLLRAQKELLQAVSHELRTPLARIRFATDLIETADSEQERQTRLQQVDSATQRLDDLVGELLTYVRLESDAPTDQPETIELNSMFENLIDLHSPLHAGIEFEIDRIVPQIKIMADRRSVARAVGNLLSNAGRYAETRVDVRAIQRQDGVLIQVDDDGPGVPEKDRDTVFSPFVRLTPGDGKGTGLGLALVQRIATRHGGTVSVTDSDSGGARFSIFLPLNADA